MVKLNLKLLLTVSAVALAVFVFYRSFKIVERFDDCWCRADGGHSQSQGDLTPQIQRFAQILSNSKYLVAREAGTSMLYFSHAPLSPNSNWTYMNGLLGNIALSDKYILGTNRDGTIFAADVSAATDAVYTNPGWFGIPGVALQVAVADDTLWVVNSSGAIFSCTGPCKDGKWTAVNGGGFDIGYDQANKRLVLRGNDNKRYLCPSAAGSQCTGNWVQG